MQVLNRVLPFGKDNVEEAQQQFVRFLALFLLFAWSIKLWYGIWLSQLQAPPFIAPKSDNFFWLLHYFNIPQFCLSNPYAGLVIDSTIILSLIGAYFRPKQWVFGLLFMLSFTVYYMSFNSAMTHHAHPMSGYIFVGFLMLLTPNAKRFTLGFYALRHYACFVMASAGLWKVGRGAFFHPNQMTNILMVQHTDYRAARGEDYWYSQFVEWLIQHPDWTQWLWYLGVVLELAFLIGFFTRKFDKWLILCFLGFFIADYWIMNLYFFEFCIFVPFFFKYKSLEAHYQSL